MPSGKDRLYVALHARSGASKMSGGEDKYHWSLIIGPKNESNNSTGTRCHAKETMQNVDGVFKSVCAYEDCLTSLQPTFAILIRVLIGKVADGARLRDVFARTPIRSGSEEYEGWNCVSWAQEALRRAADEGKALGRCQTEWSCVRDVAIWYVAKKAAAHRFDGQGQFDQTQVPTWDELERKELTA